MEAAAGNNIVSLASKADPVTGAIAVTPQTMDASGALIAAPVAANPNIALLIGLVFIQMIDV